jgi:phage-related protein
VTQPLNPAVVETVRQLQEAAGRAVADLIGGLQAVAEKVQTEANLVKAEAQALKAEASVVELDAALFAPNLEQVLEPIRQRVTDMATQAGQALQRLGTQAMRTGQQIASSVLSGARALAQLAAGYARAAVQATIMTARTVAVAVAQRVVAVATAVWSAAQRLLNLVMAMNPIGLIVAAITLLIGGLVLAYQRSTTFRNIVNAAFSAVRNVAMTVFNAIRNVVAAVWPYVQRVIQIAVTIIRTYVTTYFTVVRTVVTTVFNAVRAVVTTVWNGVRTVITGAVTAVVNTVRRVQEVYNTIRNAFNRARTAAGDAISGVVDFVRGLPGRAVGALSNIGRTLYQMGRDLIQGFINGLRDMAGNVVDAIQGSIIDRIPGPIRGALGIGSPSRLMAGIGRNVGEGLVMGIDDSRDMVADAMTRLVPAPRAAVVRPAIAGLAQAAVATVPGAGAVTPRRPPGAADSVTVNVYPRAGQSEYEIGQVAARELAWAAKS